MIELYSTSVTVSSGTQIPLNKVASSKGTSIVRAGTGSVQITKPGWYRVDVTASVIAGTAGAIGIQLYKDGDPIPYATASETASDTTSAHSITFSAIVKACSRCCNCDNAMPELSIYNVGQNAVYNIVNAIFTRIG